MNNRFLRWGIVGALLVGVLTLNSILVSRSAVYQWSKTAATNSNADASINWAEGMPPGVVNDSARAMMARLAEFRDDTSGLLTTAGTSTAYTLATNQVFGSPPNNGQLVCFVPHVTNGTAPTLATDGGTAFALQTSPSVAVTLASLIQGTPYCASFNNSSSAWVLFGAAPSALPLGTVLDFTGSSAPSSNFALAAGQAISRTTFAAYFALVGTTYGVGDGSTTFNIADLRGRVVAGVDNMGGSTAGRITVAGGNFNGTTLGASGGGENETLTQAQLPAVAPTFTGTAGGVTVGNGGTTATGGGITNTNCCAAGPINLFVNVTATTSLTGTFTPAGTISNLGSGNAHTILSPAMVLTKIIRVQ